MVTYFDPGSEAGGLTPEEEESERKRRERERLATLAGGFLPGPPQDQPTFTVPAAPAPVAAAPVRLPPVITRPEPDEYGGFLPFAEPAPGSAAFPDYEDEPFVLDIPDQSFFATGTEPDEDFLGLDIPAPDVEDQPFSLEGFDIPAPRVADEIEPGVPPPDETFVIDTLAEQQVPAPDTTFTIEADERPEGVNTPLDRSLTETLDLLRFDELNPFVEEIGDPRRRPLPPFSLDEEVPVQDIERERAAAEGPGSASFLTPTSTIDSLTQLPQGVFDDFGQFAGAAPYQELQGVARDLVATRDAPAVAPVTLDTLRAEMAKQLPPGTLDGSPLDAPDIGARWRAEAFLQSPQAQAIVDQANADINAGRLADSAAAARAIEQVNTALQMDELRQRAISSLERRRGELRAGTPLSITLSDEAGGAELNGVVRGGVFHTDNPVAPWQVQAVKDEAAKQGVTVRDWRFSEAEGGTLLTPLTEAAGLLETPVRLGSNAVQDAVRRLYAPAEGGSAGIDFLSMRLGGPELRLAERVSDATRAALEKVQFVGTTAVDQVFRGIGWATDRTAETGLQAFIRLPDTILSAEDRELKAAMHTLSRDQQNTLVSAYAGTLFSPQDKREMAEDIRQGYKADDLNQKYNNPFKDLLFRGVMDPFNLIVPVADSVRLLRGLEMTGSAISLNNRILGAGAYDAARVVTDAEAVAPWQQIRRIGDVRALGNAVRSTPGESALDVLGNASQSARASSAAIVSHGVMDLLETRLAGGIEGRSIDDLPGIIRSAAVSAERTAGDFFNGWQPNLQMQHLGFLSRDETVRVGGRSVPSTGLRAVIDDPASELSKAIVKPVYDGPQAWAQLPPAEQVRWSRTHYASQLEKERTVLGTLDEAATRIARTRYGLNADADGLVVRAQQQMRAILSTVYLTNPRYHIRNALGDATTALERGIWVKADPQSIAEYNRMHGRVTPTTGFTEWGGATTRTGVEGRTPITRGLSRIQQQAAKWEGGRRDTVWMKAHQRIWGKLRESSAADGLDLLGVLPTARPALTRFAEAQLRGARTADDIKGLRATNGSIQGLKPTAHLVLSEMDLDDMSPLVRWQLDRLAQRANRGENIGADISRLLKEQADHAQAQAQHLGQARIRPDEWTQLRREYQAARDAGVSPQEAQRRVIAGFAERNNADIKFVQARKEIQERMERRFQGEFSTLTKQHDEANDAWWAERNRRADEVFQESSAQRKAAYDGWVQWKDESRRAFEQQRQQDFNSLLVKMRQAQTGAGVGGPKVASKFQTTDDFTRHLDQQAADLRARIDAAAPGDDIDAIRQSLRDTDEALANLRGAGAIPDPVSPVRPLAAEAAAAQSAKDALLISAFADRLPGVLDEFKNAGPIRDLSPDDAKAWNAFIDRQLANFARDRSQANGAAWSMTNFVLHQYAKTSDFDFFLRWVAPWELWTTRTMAKLPLRIADHPGYFSKLDTLRSEMQETFKDRPDFLREKAYVPFPFFPSLGDHIFFDPVKLALPTDMLDNYVRKDEADTTIGKLRYLSQFAGVAPGPIADALLAMAPGWMGGADKGINGLWDTQARSPFADAYSALASASRLVGLDTGLPLRPIITQQDATDIRRQLAMMLHEGELDHAGWLSASDDIDRNLTRGLALKGSGLTDAGARAALNRVQGRTSVKQGLSAGLAILGVTWDSEAERKLRDLTDQYGRLKDTGDKAAVRTFLDAHPDLPTWWGTGQTNEQHQGTIATARYYDTLEQRKAEKQAELDALPFYGTDLDRRRIFDTYEQLAKDDTKALQAQYPMFSPPQADSLPRLLASAMFDLTPQRDNNGVIDYDASGARRTQAMDALKTPNAFEEANGVTTGDLFRQVQAAMEPTTPESVARTVVNDLYSEARGKQTEEVAKAKTREEATRIRQQFERDWRMPTNEQLADIVMERNPGRFDRAAVLKELDSSIPQTLSGFAQLNEAERVGKFQAGLDPKGVSTEPFYVDKNNGVSPIVVKTEADLQAWQRAKLDDAEYARRRAGNDPTYVNFDTEARQRWLYGGEAGAQLWRQGESILQYALGPMDPVSGQRQGTGKGWTAEYRFPDGTKMKAIEAYNLIKKFKDDLATAQSPGGKRLPSEEVTPAAQTRGANTSARSTAARSGSRTTYSRTSGGSRGGGGTAADTGPRPGQVDWFDERLLSKRELLKPETDLREGWRLGLGMTPEAFERFVGKHPDVVNAVNEMERLRGGIFEAGADQDAVTKAVQEHALKVNEVLVKARSLETERRTGPAIPRIDHIDDAVLKAANIRQGKLDLDAAFRAQTIGTDAAKWEAFKQRNPEVGAELSRVAALAQSLRSDDDSPDDVAVLNDFYSQVGSVASLITQAEAKDKERKAGPPMPNFKDVQEGRLTPARIRSGHTADNIDRALRVGSLVDEREWIAFKGRNPEVGQVIQELQKQATGLKTMDEFPDDAAGITAFYDAVANATTIIAGAREADARREAEAKRAISEAASTKARAEAEQRREQQRARDDAYYDARRAQRGGQQGSGQQLGSAGYQGSQRPVPTPTPDEEASHEANLRGPRYAALLSEHGRDAVLAAMRSGDAGQVRKRTRRGRRSGRRGSEGDE